MSPVFILRSLQPRNVLLQFGIACGVLMIRDPNLFKICPEQSFLNTTKYDSLDYLKNECKIAASWQSVLVTIAETICSKV